MKHIIYIITLFISTTIFAQKEATIVKEIKLHYTCDEGTSQAYKDFANENYKLISYGLVISEDWDFDKFYWKHMKEKYNIIMGNGGCLVDEAMLCYSNKMRALLLKKFGEDIFEKGKKEAKLLYQKKE
ncbi:hypothetical protein [Winogradskyella immobilis]|uniref:Uncharacterized protein n=1 Tax=Winogradskyella immobilis TaxID=2816852 RepID=A0ABS8ELL0_9FLAO|nr:hypothetical protein [Winogradskyella immobilis]MCC1484104.1 hypothetical protein [Winogradskyella immobilis]MCG0016196.1 hypothetical protein [Winogradskyella immobilis]